MNAAQARAMATRMLRKAGTVTWTRRTLVEDGPAGTVSVDDTQEYTVQAAQLASAQKELFQSQAWQLATVRLCVGAETLPFDPETHSGFPEPRFDDIVGFQGIDYRVMAIETWAAPGGTSASPPAVWFVGLGA